MRLRTALAAAHRSPAAVVPRMRLRTTLAAAHRFPAAVVPRMRLRTALAAAYPSPGIGVRAPLLWTFRHSCQQTPKLAPPVF